MKTQWILGSLWLPFAASACLAGTIKSPDGKIELSFQLEDIAGTKACPTYSVSYKGEPIVDTSRLGFQLEDGSILGKDLAVLSEEISTRDSTWEPVYGERSTVRDHYQQLAVRLSQGESAEMELHFRCYDAGVAVRHRILKAGPGDKIGIRREGTEFNFLADHAAWCVTSAQGKYSKKTISTMPSGVERPLVLEVAEDRYVAVAEAALVDYARMKLGRGKGKPHSLVSELSSSVQASLPLTTPWRVIMIAESPGRLLENNDILLNLNEPNAIGDPSWIKPGKVIREVTLTTKGGIACVDFAVEHKLQYVEFDAGWYGHEYSNESDARTVTVDPKRSPGPLDLPEVIRYGDERGIGIILYVNRRALERDLDELLPLYEKWGVKGLKYGFVNVGSQKWTSWLHEAVRKAADHKLMLVVHDEYRPTGYSRTYPNLMTQEGIGGDETSPSNSQTLAILFTRMLAGAGDNTICYYDQRVDRNASHAYQLAKAVCIYSPWQFLYWYDRPDISPQKKGGAGGQKGVIGNEPELEFFDHVPTVWDDSKVIHGSIGRYAVMARRSGENWFIGCMNSGEDRTLEVPLGFLREGTRYVAHIYSDDPEVDTRTHVRIDRYLVDASTTLKVSMTAKGGQAIRIVPVKAEDRYPRYGN